MTDPDTETQSLVRELGRRHEVSEEAVAILVRAVRSGGGTAAQFSHPQLGGMGQWSRGGMIMIGDMFNDGLKARVAALCEEIARDLQDGRLTSHGGEVGDGDADRASPGCWWPRELGTPASTGAQNSMRYAFFPATRRLAVERDGRLTVYDTGEHQLSGFSQQQSTAQSLAFSSQHGPVRLEQLREVPDAGAHA